MITRIVYRKFCKKASPNTDHMNQFLEHFPDFILSDNTNSTSDPVINAL